MGIGLSLQKVMTLVALTLLAGCTTLNTGPRPTTPPTPTRTALADGPPDTPLDSTLIQDAVPRTEPLSKYGNPPSYEVFGTRYVTVTQRYPYREQGIASWYGKKFHGLRTSSGEPYDMFAMTAAHRSLPLPTYARVTNLDNRKSVIVKINDRGPFHNDRLIDLSYAAAVKLDMAGHGTGRVEVETINPDQINSQAPPPAPSSPTTYTPPRQTQMFVQLGAFSEKRNAENLQQKLQTVHNKVHIANTQSNQGPPLYRVRIGPLADASEAARLHSHTAGLGLHPYVIYESRNGD